MTAATRLCITCNKSIKGRTDKKFCDDYCRSTYNNQLNGNDNNYVRNINNILRRNRRILEELLPASSPMIKLPRHNLQFKGFHFRYFTHTVTSKKGNTYYFCYDLGYLPLTNDRLVIIRKKEIT